MEFPVRINKYLALKNIATRRGADELIEKKQVFINGKLALLGSRVNEKDKVEIKGDILNKKLVYYKYNKPVGIITHSPSDEEKDIKENIINKNIPKDVFPIGRLDKDSHGLIVLTNDGRITDKLLNPKYIHEKEYVVKTSNKLRTSFKSKMENGVNIEGYVTQKCKVQVINENTFKIILSEGKKHQIRRMCSALFQEVADLKRTRIMNIKLGSLKSGSVEEIKGKDLETFLASIFK